MLKYLSAHADLNHVSERALHARAKGILLDSVQDEYHAFIINDDQVCDMFKYLKQYNIDDNPQSSIVNERTKLKSFQLSVSNVTSFLSQARTSYNKLSALGSPMSDQDYFITLIHHIPAEYNFIRAQLIGTQFPSVRAFESAFKAQFSIQHQSVNPGPTSTPALKTSTEPTSHCMYCNKVGRSDVQPSSPTV